MVIDHIGAFIPNAPIWMRQVGRISAPIFSFCMSEGMRHTSARRKYIQRLYVSSIVMAACNGLFEILTEICGKKIVIENNYFSTLFSSAVLIFLVEYSKKHPKQKKIWTYYLVWQLVGGVLWMIGPELLYIPTSVNNIVFTIMGNIFSAEGSLLFVILGPIFYFTKQNKKKMLVYYGTICGIQLLNASTGVFGKILFTLGKDVLIGITEVFTGIGLWGTWTINSLDLSYIFKRNFQWLMIGALPFILRYNNQEGTKSKYFYYLFYPVHIYLLNLVRVIM